MGMRMTDLSCKEVICVTDGRRLGFVSDIELELPSGRALALVVPGPSRLAGLLGRREDYVIPWGCIRRIGPDTVLVEVVPEDCCRPRQKPLWFPG